MMTKEPLKSFDHEFLVSFCPKLITDRFYIVGKETYFNIRNLNCFLGRLLRKWSKTIFWKIANVIMIEMI